MFKSKTKLNILIIGCSHIGASFANECSELGHNVIVIDKDHHAFLRLDEHYMGARITEDGADKNVLECANIQKMDVVIAATDFENVNIMVAQMAKKFYQINQVISILETKSKESVCENMGIDFIYPTRLSICELEKKLNIEGVSLWK